MSMNGSGEQSLVAASSPYSFTSTPMTMEPTSRGVEPVYFQLTRYVTVFLVDDSTSMEDIPEFGISSWSDTIYALTECAKLILGARGKLKVHFFNSPKSKENISGVTELQDLCRFRPRGDTPTYQRLKRHLDEFMEAFEPLNASQREAYPGLNLVIFTDGAPEGPFEDIEEVIVDMAKDLDSLRADKYKVGIQFVQIGNDESVTNFFERVDNEIKGEHGLRRDVSAPSSHHVQTSQTDPFCRSSIQPATTVRLRMRTLTRKLFLVLSTRAKTGKHRVPHHLQHITVQAMGALKSS